MTEPERQITCGAQHPTAGWRCVREIGHYPTTDHGYAGIYWRSSDEGFEERVRALFAAGPDTVVRTTWRDGVTYLEVPLADLQAALDGEADHTVEDERVEHIVATLGGALEQHIHATQSKIKKLEMVAASPAGQDRIAELREQERILLLALDLRNRKIQEAL